MSEDFAGAGSAAPPGLSQGLLTPMTDDGAVDYAALERLTLFHLEIGRAPSLCLLLHLGESPSLTLEERQQIVERVSQVVAGRVPFSVHVSTGDTLGQITLARHAHAHGAWAAISLPPYERRLSTSEIAAHFQRLSDGADLPIVVYSSFGTGHGVTASLVEALCRQGVRIAGVKDAGFELAYAADVTARLAPIHRTFAFMPGVECITPFMALGVRSGISICGSVAPRLISALSDAVAANDWARASELQPSVSQLLALMLQNYPGSAKAAMALMGRPVGSPRSPLPALQRTEIDALAASLEAIPAMAAEPRGW